MSAGLRVRVFAMALAFLAPATPALAGIPGDIDNDCEVDVADAVLLERSLTGFVVLTDEQTGNANLTPIGGTRDAIVDFGDLVTLKRIVARDAEPATPPYPPPTTNTIPPDGTTNPISVSGTAQTGVAGLQAVLYVNGRRLAYTAAVDQTTGAYEFGNTVPLFDGANKITVQVRNSSGSLQSCGSVPRTTTYTPPQVLSGSALNFSGNLPQTMVWTPALSAGQPYVVTSTLTIPNTKSLYIGPDVDVKFANGAKLIVQNGGNLKILGSPGHEIDLVPNNAPACSSVRWGGIEVMSSAAFAVLIEYARIDCVTTGLHVLVNGNATFNNGTVSNFNNAGLMSDANAAWMSVQFSTISGIGDGISMSAVNTYIRGNTITATQTGIWTSATQDPTSRYVIERNVITGASRAGIEVYTAASSLFSQNTITQNCIGIRLMATDQARPRFIGNSIFNNNHVCACSAGSHNCKDYTYGVTGGQPNYECSTPSPPPPGWLDATGNWWGSTNPSVIQSRIDQPCASNPIDYTPYLSAPYDQVGYSVGGSNLIMGNIHDGNKPATGQDWIVVGTPTVPAGQTFTIPDGQVLRFSTASELIVAGTLVVQDTNASPVVFTALTPPGATPSPGDWKGIVVQDAGTATIAGALILNAQRAIQAKDRRLVLRDSLIELFSETAVYLDKSTSTTAPITVLQRNLIDNFPDLNAHASPGSATGTGVWLVDASPNLFGNEIQDVQYGIRATGDSQPRIDGNTADGPNLIHHTTHGISLEGTGDFDDPHDPDLVDFHKNRLFSNSGSNLRLAFTVGGGPPVDAKNNYWGVTTEAGIRATIINANDGAPASVDISGFLDDGMNVVGGSGVFSTLLSNVGVDRRLITPTLDAIDVQIRFTLAAPANVTLKMFPETENNPGSATPVKTLLASAALAAGPHTIPWDGTDTLGATVGDEAYAFQLVATTATLSETYFPSRPALIGTEGVDQFHGEMAGVFDPRLNDYEKVNYNLGVDGRVKVIIDPDYESDAQPGPQPPFLAYSKALLELPGPTANFLYFMFDGRYPDSHATTPGQIIDTVPGPNNPKIRVTFPLPDTFRPNFVIVDRTKPVVKGPDFTRYPPSTYFPRIEVRPEPYFITHSYNQTSRIRYCVDQPSQVTVKVLPYGAVTPSVGMPLTSEITVFSGSVGAITSCSTSSFHGINLDLTNGASENVDLDAEGEHTFTIEAVSLANPAFKTLYRGVIHQQR